MQIIKSITLAALAATSVSASQTIKVKVGDGGKKFDPANIQAKIGDKVEFTFFPMNHTVTQSNFKDVCQPIAGAFNSGFMPTKEGPSKTTFTIDVKDTKPIWFYCAQGDHCKSGMVGAINAPATGNTFDAFLGLAKSFNGTSKPGPSAPVGGTISNGNANTSGSTSVAKPYTTSKPASVYTKTWTYTTQSGDKTVTVTTSALTTAPPTIVTVTPSGAQGGDAAQATTTGAPVKGAGAAVTAPAMMAGAAVLAAAAFL